MDYIYLVNLNSYLNDDEIKPTDLCHCRVSNRNILAIANDCCVYILPLEKPNELIPVTLSNSPCMDLAWSNDGLFLLNVSKSGVCNLYSVKSTLLNSIDLVYTFQISKNDLACIKPFSKSSKLCLENRDSLNYFEKFSYNSSFNCLKNVGTQNFNGFILLTRSGMLHVFLTDFNSIKSKYNKYDFDMNLKENFKNQSENVMDFDSNETTPRVDQENEIISYDLADFVYESDGSLTVAFTNSDVESPIYLYKVSISLNYKTSGLIEGTSELISTIILSDSIGLKSSISFTSDQSSKCLAVLLNQNNIQFWNRNDINWNLTSSYQSQSNITRINMPKHKDYFADEKAFILVSYENGTTGFIDAETFTQEFVLSKIPSVAPKSNEYLVALDQSFTGSIGIGITNNSSLVVFRQFHMNNSNIDFSLLKIQKCLINFYEYCMLSGYDYWDLLISTNPKMIDILIDNLEKRYLNQSQQSIKKAYFSRFYSLMYSLSRRSTIKSISEHKSLDILIKLTLNRSILFLSNSVQISLNVDSLINANNLNINTSMQPPLINTSIISSNSDIINQVAVPSNISHLTFKTNLNDYFSDVLQLDAENLNEILNVNEIVQSIINRKNNIVTLNQQVKHIFQWIIEITLDLIDEIILSINKSSDHQDQSETSLLNDYWFLNELRKGLVFIKLIYVVNQSNTSSSSQLLSNNSLINSSLPILSFKSLIVNNSYQQKDIISDLFNIITKLMHKSNPAEKKDFLLEKCQSIQADRMTKTKSFSKFFNLKNTWFGLSSSSWLKTFHFPVDHLFEAEKIREHYPYCLFDIVRLIDFCRSNLTKQCFRCGNYTESNTSNTISNNVNNNNNSNNNNISNSNSPNNNPNINNPSNNNTSSSKTNSGNNMQDFCGDKCVCGGFWVLSSLLQ